MPPEPDPQSAPERDGASERGEGGIEDEFLGRLVDLQLLDPLGYREV